MPGEFQRAGPFHSPAFSSNRCHLFITFEQSCSFPNRILIFKLLENVAANFRLDEQIYNNIN
jgi:hypothetical protein